MKFYVYSDIHSQKLYLPDDEPDFVILLGDIDWRDVKKIDNHFSCNKLGVIGNHDPLDTYRNTKVIYIHEKVEEIEGIVFAGFGGSPRYNNKQNCGQYDEWEAEKFIKNMGNVDIFLAHSNPVYNYSFDRTDSHRGFPAFNHMFNRKQTKLFFHGHIHENEEYSIKETLVISSYGFREYIL